VSPAAGVFCDRLPLGDRSYIAGYGYVTGEVDTGPDCTINPYAVVRGKVRLGDGVRVGAHASIVGFNHGTADLDQPIHRQPHTSRGIVIGDDVWVGSGAIVHDGVTVGAQVPEALARALELTSDGREHLFVLAGAATSSPLHRVGGTCCCGCSAIATPGTVWSRPGAPRPAPTCSTSASPMRPCRRSRLRAARAAALGGQRDLPGVVGRARRRRARTHAQDPAAPRARAAGDVRQLQTRLGHDPTLRLRVLLPADDRTRRILAERFG
jgi:hypothetical protein